MRPGLLLPGALLAVLAGGCASPAPPDPVVAPPTPGGTTSTANPTEPPAADSVPSATARPAPPTAKPGAAEQARLDAALIAAAWDNDLDRARGLIRRGADVNAEDRTEQSAFLIATSEGHRELLELTLRHGGDVDAKDSFNGTGLIGAADRGHADIAGRLIQAGVEVDHVNRLGWSALHEAIILGDGSPRYVDTVRVLVAAGADVQLPSQRDGTAPLDHARTRGFTEIADVLRAALDRRQPPRGEANRALLAASRTGGATAAVLALRAGADLETRDARGRTPLLLAVTQNRPAVARLLIYLGADPERADADGVTALQHAQRRGQPEVTRLLRRASALR
ncbi:MAG: ankyrin repeat domain-containing protein [Actinomycetes bacterium]